LQGRSTIILSSIPIDQSFLGGGPMNRTYPQGITDRHVATDDIVCGSPCLGAVIVLTAEEWSQFALGQLIALGIATSILTVFVLVLSLFSQIG
jgi:hypothetical protein